MTEAAGRGVMLLVSGPSGSGKSTICKRLLEDPRVVFSISATTRAPRAGEADGVHYHFLSPDEFQDRIRRGEFIEHAEVHGNMYGTLRAPMEMALDQGLVYLVEIDVQGALQLRTLGVEGLYVFIAPPGEAVEDRLVTLRARLSGRGTDAPEVVERRLQKAEDELREAHRYDHVVVNDDLEAAVAEVRRLAGLVDRG